MLIFADPHIREKNIKELDTIFFEIEKWIEPDEVIVCLGDWYHNKRPTAIEIEFGTEWATHFRKISKDFHMIRGNHPMVTYNKNESSVEYLEHTDIKVVEDIVIDNMYFGHKMTEKSNMAFGLVVPSISRYEVLVEDLKKYRYSFLGHQHQFQVIDENIYHPGAIIYNTFGEVHSKGRYIVKMKEKPFIIQLETPIPMVDIIDIKHLDQVPERTKVRFIFNDFQDFRNNINSIQKYKGKFEDFTK